jgi:hypothetical protein
VTIVKVFPPVGRTQTLSDIRFFKCCDILLTEPRSVTMSPRITLLEHVMCWNVFKIAVMQRTNSNTDKGEFAPEQLRATA